jgi:serine/threonine-protein kinase RIO1
MSKYLSAEVEIFISPCSDLLCMFATCFHLKRFQHGYCRHNPRKMVRTWAEKEMRNLRRLYRAGILCPEPLLQKSHVLVMGFVGNDGR